MGLSACASKAPIAWSRCSKSTRDTRETHLQGKRLKTGENVTVEHGCFVISNSTDGERQSVWLHAHHDPGSGAVVDPTGAGNTFLGAAAIGYLQHKNFVTAAAYGSVAASFAVEVIGLPDVEKCDAKARLEAYMAQLLFPF